MRKIVVTEFISLDGVIEDPGGGEAFDRGGWSFKFNDPEGMQYKLEEVQTHDALLLGRTTYDGFAAAWPGQTDEAGFADKMNSMPKYVVSSTLKDPTWSNTTVIDGDGDVAAAVAELKQRDGGDILVAGSATLIQTLIEHGLIDEYRLMMFPIVVGAGKRLFGATADLALLELAESRTLPSGTLILHYRPAATASA